MIGAFNESFLGGGGFVIGLDVVKIVGYTDGLIDGGGVGDCSVNEKDELIECDRQCCKVHRNIYRGWFLCRMYRRHISRAVCW
jgi:hypothetical protein